MSALAQRTSLGWMLITLLQPSWQNLCYSAWITQHQLIEMELNIGTFAIVLARHGAPASESAKPLLADGCLPHNQRFLIACLKLIWRLFLICWIWLAKFVARLWSWLPFDYSNMPDYDKAFQGIILILIGSQWKSIYFQIHVASTVLLLPDWDLILIGQILLSNAPH